jgi:recombination protein RecT
MSEKQIVTTVASLVNQDSYRKRFEQVLGKRAAQFMSSLVTASNSPALKDADPKSVVAAAMVAATLDLPIDKNLGFAHIVAYNTNGKKIAQFQMGYKGYIQLAMRSGQYVKMNALPINQEAFGGYDSEVGEPIIFWDKVDPVKPIVGYAFAWKLANGFVKTCYWSEARVMEHAKKYSQAVKKEKKDSPWFTQPEVMKIKTVISNELRRWGILSIEMQHAFTHDQGAQNDVDSPVEFVDAEAEASRPTFEAETVPASTDAPPAPGTPAATPPAAGSTAPTTPPTVPPATTPAPSGEMTAKEKLIIRLEEAEIPVLAFETVLKKEGLISNTGNIQTLPEKKAAQVLENFDKLAGQVVKA